MKSTLLLLLLLFGSSVARATSFYTFNGGGTSGNWNSAATWTTDPTGSTGVGAAVPGAADDVFITNGYTVLLTANVATTGLKINILQGGTLNLGTSTFTAAAPSLAQLAGQGTLRVGQAYFPSIGTNDFDDADTGTVEFYNWSPAAAVLPQPGSGLYNNLRLLNTTGTAYVAQFDAAALTLNGTLTLARTGAGAVALNFGATASANRVLTVNGDVTVGVGTALGVTAVDGIHRLNANASLVNNGTINLYNTDAQYTNLVFGGGADANFACNSATDLALWTVNKGINSAALLNVTSTATALVGGNLRLNYQGAVNLLTLTNGVLKLGANIVLPKLSNNTSNYDVGTSAISPTLWIAGATVQNNISNALVIYGTYRITAGSFETVKATGEGAVIREDGRYQIEGGTTTVTKFRPSTTATTHRGSFSMSGGLFIASGTGSNDNYARFSIPYPAQSFQMSGGTIRVSNPETTGTGIAGGLHIGVTLANADVTGGTFELICPNAGTNFRLVSTAPLWDVIITKPVAGGTAVVQLAGIGAGTSTSPGTVAQPLVVQHNLTLSGGNTATLDANGQNVTVQGNFTINSATAYATGTANTTFFTGSATQLFINNNATAQSLYNLTVNKTGGILQLSSVASSFAITNDLNLLSGVLFDGGKTLNVQGNIINSGTHTSSGSGSITLVGGTMQTLGGNGLGVFGNLTISSTVVGVAATLTAAQSVSGTLTLASNNKLNIDVYHLALTDGSTGTLVAGAGGFGVSRMIQTSGKQSDGGLGKTFGGIGIGFVYPVGVNGKYTPATITLNSVPQSYGQVSVSPANVQEPFVTNPAALKYFWKVRSTGFGSINSSGVTLSFVDDNADVLGGTPSPLDYVPGRYAPATATWSTTNLVTQVLENTPSGAITINFPSSNFLDGEYTAGRPAAFNAVTAFYSTASGDWENPTTWSNVSSSGPAASTIPGPSNPVFVGAAGLPHYVTVTGGIAQDTPARSGSLVIANDATLDLQTITGNNFGSLPDAVAGGEGKLRISVPSGGTVAEFPKGDFGSFLGALGGTVEYYITGATGFILPTASPAPFNLSLRTYRNLILNATAGSGQSIDLPNANLRIFNSLRTGTVDPAGSVSFTGTVQTNNVATSGSNELRVDGLLSVEKGTLQYAPLAGFSQSIVANGDVQISTGATFKAAGTGTANALLVAGSLINNGVLNLNTTSAGTGAGTASLTFTGASDKALTGTAATAVATLATLTVNKGTSPNTVLTVDLAGSLVTPTFNWLTLTNGTLRYAKAAVLNIHAPSATATTANSAYIIPEQAGLTVDAVGAVVNVATNNTTGTNLADLQLAGQLRVLQGTLNVGLAANTVGNDIEYAAGGHPRIQVTGGTLNVNGKIRRGLITTLGALQYEQSGGLVDIAGVQSASQGRGSLEVVGAGSTFRTSGGTLALHRTDGTTVGDLYLRPDTTAVTGGTVALGNTNSATSYTIGIDSNTPLFTVRVEANAAAGINTGIIRFLPLTLLGSLQIGDATAAATSNNRAIFNANGQDLTIGQDLANNNTTASNLVNAGGYRPGIVTQTTTFNGTGNAQNLLGAATNVTAFGNLTLNNTGGTLTLDATTGRNAYVSGTLTLTKGTLNDNGRTITAVGEVANSATHTSGSGGQLLLAGTANQTLSGNDTGKFGNLQLNNTTGATATADQQVTGTLTLTTGILDIGSQLLYVSNPAAAAIASATATAYIRTNGLVADQGVRKAYPAAASDFTFPVGVAGKYTPARFNVTANTAVGTVTVRPINSAHPATTAPANTELNYYWKVNSTGLGGAAVTQVYNYLNGDVQGTESAYVTGRFFNDAWVPLNGIPSTVDATANTMTLTGVNYFEGDYTAGAPAEFATVTVLYSRTATAGTPGGSNWNDANSWTIDPTGAGAAASIFPTQSNPTTILPGHQINATGSGLGTEHLVLSGILDLGAFTANNFNTVTGTGTLRIGSAVFPAGNYNAFVAASGGTVAYTGAVLLPARDTYNNLQLSGGNAKTLSNLDLIVNGLLQVDASTTATNASSQSITLTSATQGVQLVGGTLVMNNGDLSVGANLLNSGTLSLGAGAVSIGTATGSPAISVSNTGTITAGSGAFVVGKDFANGAGGNFTAGTGNLTVPGNFSNNGSYTATSNRLTVGGDFANSSSFTMGASQLDVSGNFINGGNGFVAGTNSLVRLLGNTNRTLTGTTAFYDLQKLNNGDLTLGTATDVTVTNLLTLDNGKLITGTANKVLLTNSATATPILGTSGTVYVQGRLAITFPNDANAVREFPIGNGGVYRPVTIRQNAVSTAPQVLVEMINTTPVGTVNTPLTNLSHVRYYRVQLLAGAIASPTVQLSFNNNGQVDEPAYVPANLRIAKANSASVPSGVWTNEGGTGAYSPSAPAGIAVSSSATFTSIDATSFFALASTNTTNNPLPVELTKFTATPVGKAVQLAWATATEKSSAYFEVQRSADGRNFEFLAQVAAQGTSSSLHTYEQRDARPLPGTSYYRLRLVDLDGTFSYSPVATVRFAETTGQADVALYPNPSKGDGFHLAALNLPAGPATVRVLDLQGRLVSQHTVDFAQPDVAITPTQKLTAGIYLVTVQTSAGRFTHRLVVE